jgi:hypothetical protein
MVRILGGDNRVCSGVTRRELLRFGGLGVLGLASGSPGAAWAATAPRARSLLFISLFGGPAHQDIWDLKPDAPAEVRGEFKPIRTNVAGIDITEHLPRLARIAHRYSLVRSVTHLDNGHGSAMYAGFTGWEHRFPNTNPIPSSDDYPAYGCAVSHLRPPSGSVPPFLAVGGTQFVCGNQIPGQRAGLLGPEYEPFVVDGNPNSPGFRVPELSQPDGLTLMRQDRRRSLLGEVDATLALGERAGGAGALDAARRRAYELLGSRSVKDALDLSRESTATRDTYNRTTFGQSLLLARRLIEAEVPCITVSWSRGASWDTHGGNFTGLKGSLLPPFDWSFSALLTDLHDRGLLEQTLVVCTGEFGRTPQINAGAGRDHWAGVYTVVLAGGGIQGGRVHGSSDASAGYPATDPVGPWDIAATVYQQLGVSPDTMIHDRGGRPVRLCRGEPINSLV